MKTFFTLVLLCSSIYLFRADELQVHQKPSYLSLAPAQTDGENNRFTVNTFTNNLLILLGLTPDQTEQKEEPFFYSSKPLQIPESVWLFHVEGLDHLTNTGIRLVQGNGFHIDNIDTQLSKTDDSNSLITGTVLITSESDIDHLGETLQNQVSQMSGDGLMKYLIILCDECNNERAVERVDQTLKNIITDVVAKNPQGLVMTLVTKESGRIRRARQADTSTSNITIATFYSDEYSTMFNLFFWTSLVFAIIIIAIVYVFLTLDPGADTIIYRMTTPRLKAE